MDLLHHMKIKTINKRFNLLLLAAFALVLASWTLTATADVQPVIVSTATNQPITITLSRSITNVTRPVTVTVGNPAPANGGAVPVACADQTNECITYTPDADYIGRDSFAYVVTDSGDPQLVESSTITVIVGTDINEGALPPPVIIGGVMLDICGNPTDLPPENEAPETTLFCEDFRGLTPGVDDEDLRELLSALTPQNVAAAGTLSNDLASQQLNNIGKRLAALRSGQRLASMGGLALQHNNNTISGAQIAQMFDNQETTTGGGATADGYSKQWGWFINGNFGGGSQDQSVYEDGFEFDTAGLSSGFD